MGLGCRCDTDGAVPLRESVAFLSIATHVTLDADSRRRVGSAGTEHVVAGDTQADSRP